MRFSLAPALAVLMLVQPAGGTMAQDILKPLQTLVDDLVPPRPRPAPVAEREKAAKAEAEAETEAPPIPLPRPDNGEGEEATDAAGPAEDETEAVSPEADKPEASEAEETAKPSEPEPEPEAPAKPAEPHEDGRIYQTACPAVLSGIVEAEMLPPVADGVCGTQSPLSVTAVNVNGHRVAFASPVTTTCAMAGALADWVGEIDTYAQAALESRVESLASGPGLVCRNRVSSEDDKISEHAFADALDVMSFTLANGETISVEAGWPRRTTPEGKFLRQSHGAACGRFTTVLGPEANADHANHFHLDLGCHGKSCTARICE
ncbi:extensin family protein [Devosia sp. PTR5]|uniref:Extensin family protein n=1 Tax=Devosia oryzisoli TaxID=2774138 RepID=A0A927FWS0_9HYPH|nr:extensin family protein [Devosia oryzisoli]MBD8066253.1 extensin family protein [Devosia oryzisoli]